MVPEQASRNTVLPDAVANHWVDTRAPVGWRPFLRLARLDRPIGWWLLLLPCWWSTALAAIAQGARLEHLVHALLFMIGAIVMRGAGSTYNDIIDRDLDAQVTRTRGRPLPSGQVSVRAAALLAVALSLVGLAVLLQFNRATIVLGFGSLVVVAIYPFMKRITGMPQLVLGLAFSWGALVGWSASFGTLAAPALWLYLAAVAWTVAYDTIYALQDLEDDSIVGIHSSARTFGSHARQAIAALHGLSVVASALALWWIDAGPYAWAGLVGFAAHLGWQIRRLARADKAMVLRLFRSNRDAGLFLTAGLLLQALAPLV